MINDVSCSYIAKRLHISSISVVDRGDSTNAICSKNYDKKITFQNERKVWNKCRFGCRIFSMATTAVNLGNGQKSSNKFHESKVLVK